MPHQARRRPLRVAAVRDLQGIVNAWAVERMRLREAFPGAERAGGQAAGALGTLRTVTRTLVSDPADRQQALGMIARLETMLRWYARYYGADHAARPVGRPRSGQPLKAKLRQVMSTYDLTASDVARLMVEHWQPHLPAHLRRELLGDYRDKAAAIKYLAERIRRRR